MGTDIRSNLAFILSQLKVAEAPAAVGPEVGDDDDNDEDDYLDEYGRLNSYDIDDDDASAPAPADPVSSPPQDDILVGTSGGDLVFGFAGTDFIVAGAGADFVRAGAGSDFVDGEAGWDVLLGDDDDDDMFGGDDDSDGTFDGNETLWGLDNVVAGSSDDTSNSVNVVDSGQGEDVFIFGSTTRAHGDTIRGFQAGDKIDLSGIDANTGTVGNDTFTLEAGQTTTAPGQIAVAHETREDGEYTAISGDTAGDAAPEFGINTASNHVLTGDDFDL